MIIYGSSDATLNPAGVRIGTAGHVILLPDHAEDVFGTYRLSVMTDKRTGSFGTWSSPIAADAVVTDAVSLLEPHIKGDSIYWIEARPLERGRNVIVRPPP